ncbi:MAG: Gfo/Idh/MocA family oxidoreductase [Anaerolineales bacterium]|nr:Gfo/Idh/MocA family oxidoreductase [Anaerolineales bacterium]
MIEGLQVGIIGLGQIAQRGHIPGFQRAGAKVVAACDVNEATAKQVCEKFGLTSYYTDWKTMLDEGGFGAVSICTPPSFHAEMAIECAGRGLHVLTEKPMAPSLEDCDRMIAASEENHVILMVSHSQRYKGAHQTAKRIIQTGRLGKPYMIQSVFGHPGPEKWSETGQWYFNPAVAQMGVMSDLGYHKLDLMQWLLDDQVVNIKAFMGTYEKDTTLEDSAACVLHFKSGVIGTMLVSWDFKPDMDNSISIRFEKGALMVPADDPNKLIIREAFGTDRTEEMVYTNKSTDPSGWFGAISDFVKAVENGLPSPIPGTVGKQVMSLLHQAYESVSSGNLTI